MKEAGYDRTLQQFLDLWVKPEIQRRKTLGVLEGDFVLRAFQVVSPSSEEDRLNVLRLNHEVKVIAKVKLAKAVQRGRFFLSLPMISREACGFLKKMSQTPRTSLLFDSTTPV